VWTLGNDKTSALINRVAGQFTGAFFGAYLTLWIALIPYVPEPASSVGVTMFILLELIFSGLFVLLFLLMVFPATKRVRSISVAIIGIGFMACLLVVEPLIGFGMHPALNSAFSYVDYMQGGRSYLHLPVYLFTPLVAGILVALVYKKLLFPLMED
jgi:glycerol uptake facilitator-like aquaporin